MVTPAASSCRPVPTFPMRAQMAFSKPDHPLFSPVVDGTTIQKAANARRVSVFLCVPPRSPKSSASRTQVYLFWHWHFVLIEHASCHLPNISSCPPFLPFLPQLSPRTSGERHSVSPSYPIIPPTISFAHGAPPFQTLLQDTVLYPAEHNRRDLSSWCALRRPRIFSRIIGFSLI